jgi:acyl-CoA thioesterase-1
MQPLPERGRHGQRHRLETPLPYGAVRGFFNGLAALAVALLLICCGAGTASLAAAPPRIIALGDSLTAGYGVAPEDAFPVKLAAHLKSLGVAADIVDASVSGDTSADGLARLDWALSDHPQYALVELGANDMLRAIDPKVTYANLDAILTKLQQGGVKVLLVGMQAAPNWGSDYQKQFDAIYPDLAAKHHVPLYPFFLDGVALDRNLNQGDGLHPKAAGVDIIVERITPYVERLLQTGS